MVSDKLQRSVFVCPILNLNPLFPLGCYCGGSLWKINCLDNINKLQQINKAVRRLFNGLESKPKRGLLGRAI